MVADFELSRCFAVVVPIEQKGSRRPIHYMNDDFVAGISDLVVTIFLSTHISEKNFSIQSWSGKQFQIL
jgi:hypothetical protein